MLDLTDFFLVGKFKDNFFTITGTKATIGNISDQSIVDTINVRVSSPIATIKNSKLLYFEKNELIVKDLIKKNNFLTVPFPTTDDITAVDISSDSLIVALGKNNGQIMLLSVIGSKMLTALTVFKGQSISNVVVHTEGNVFVSSENSIRILNGIERKIDGKIDETSQIGFMKIINNFLVYSTKDKEIKFWNIETKTVDKIFKNSPIDIINFEMLENEKRFVILAKDGVVIHNTEYPSDVPKPISGTHHTEGIVGLTNSNNILLANKYDEFESYDPMIVHIQKKAEKTPKDGEDFDIDFDNEISSDRKITVMTVDDSATMRLIIKNAILKEFENVEILEAADGVLAMSVLKQNPNTDIMFLDWNMPNMNGEEVVNAINELDTYPDLNIIMATTEGVKSKVRKMVSKGVKGYLVKPFSPDSIIEISGKIINYIRSKK